MTLSTQLTNGLPEGEKLVLPMKCAAPIYRKSMRVMWFLASWVYQFITLCQFYKGPYVTREETVFSRIPFSKRDVLFRTSLTKVSWGKKSKWGTHHSWNLIEKRTNLSEKMEGLSVAPFSRPRTPEPERWWEAACCNVIPHDGSSWSPTSSAKLTTSYHAWNEKFFFFQCIYLAALGLCCSMPDLHCIT